MEILNRKIECFFASRWLEPFFDGEVGGWRSTLVQTHVDRCHMCHERLREMQDLRSALRRAAAGAPDSANVDELWARLSSRIPRSSDVYTGRQWFGRFQRMLIPRRLVWAPAALALVLAVAAGVMWQSLSSMPEKSNAVIIDYIESKDSSVMIVQPQKPGDMTVIWIFEEAKRGPSA